jgi:anaerobic selenocysteine-containing dehydrogenase
MEVRTNCRSCVAGCGILVSVEGDQVLEVRGDPEHPLSHGYVCPKGHALAWSHHREDRLNVPMIRGDKVTWPEMIDDLARGFSTLLARFGPDSIAKYGGNGGACDTLAGVSNQFLAALGSSQEYSAATIDVTPAWRVAEMVTGTRRLIPRWIPEDKQSRLVVWIGGNPLVSHGYNTSLPDPVRRIRAFRRRGGRTWVVDPKRTKSASMVDNHLHVRPGSDLALLGWLVRQRIEAQSLSATFLSSTSLNERERLARALAPFTDELTAATCGVGVEDLHRLDDDIAWAGRLAVIIGTGVTFNKHAVIIDWLRWILLSMTDSLDQAGGMWFNPGWFDPLDQRQSPITRIGETLPRPASRPELKRVFGQVPVAAMVDEIRSGMLRALIVSGGNPIDAFPEPDATTEALRQLDMLVVSDVYPSSTTRIATHVIPALGQLERYDLLQNTRVTVAPPVVRPVGDRRPLWWVLASVARKMGMDILSGLDPDATTDVDLLRVMLSRGRGDADAVFASGSHGVAVPHEAGYVAERVLPEGRWNILPAELLNRLEVIDPRPDADSRFVFVCGRQLGRNNSVYYVPPEKRRGDLPHAAISPSDAERLDLAEGDVVQITSPDGTMTAAARIDASVLDGVVSVTHGYHEAGVGHLMSRSRWVDPLSGQPAMSAIPVTVEKVTSN